MNSKIYIGDSRITNWELIGKVDLVVTSPPYPMIKMWDELFTNMNAEVGVALEEKDGYRAFDLMNEELNKIWENVDKYVKPGGIVCINIGDATRTIGDNFRIYMTHSKIIDFFVSKNYDCLPSIIWDKVTNSPNKYMGSGMLPVKAYVTLEFEHILIFRKPPTREFEVKKEVPLRRTSAFFYEERNVWFSNIWSLVGASQILNNSKSRERTAAYPYELAYRLINMFSIKGDVVYDPFLGTGTTISAAIGSERIGIGTEIDVNYAKNSAEIICHSKAFSNKKIESRIKKHESYVDLEKVKGKEFKYFNNIINSPVKTRWERLLFFTSIESIDIKSSNEEVIEIATTYEQNKDTNVS